MWRARGRATHLDLVQLELRRDLPDFRRLWKPLIESYLGASTNNELVLSAWMPQKAFVGLSDHAEKRLAKTSQYAGRDGRASTKLLIKGKHNR